MSFATISGRSGRGPTNDRSPFMIFQSWGSSSRCEARRTRPIGVTRGSFLCGPLSAVPFRVRAHRAELIKRELAPVLAHPHLAVDHGTARGCDDDKRDHGLDREEDDANRDRSQELDRPLEGIVEPRHILNILKEPSFSELAEGDFPHDKFIETFNVRDQYALSEKAVKDGGERAFLLELPRDYDEVRVVLPRGGLKHRRRSMHRFLPEARRHAVAKLAILLDGLFDLGGQQVRLPRGAPYSGLRLFLLHGSIRAARRVR